MQGVFISAIKYLDQKSHVISTNNPMARTNYITLPSCKGAENCKKTYEIFSITNPLQFFFFNIILSALHVTKISQSYDYRERYPSHFASVNKNVIVN